VEDFKMDIIVDGHVEILSLIDPKTGLDWFREFIGNTDALNTSDFGLDTEVLLYTCTKETYDWWSRVALAHQLLEDRMYELVQEHGSEAVYAALAGAFNGHDLETQPLSANAALDEAFASES
jgi:hypothetical protein